MDRFGSGIRPVLLFMLPFSGNSADTNAEDKTFPCIHDKRPA